MKTLLKALQSLEAYIPQASQKKAEVSEKAVGWHLAHSILVVDKIYDQVAASDPIAYAGKFNGHLWAMQYTRTIPRGRGKAPQVVMPSSEFYEEAAYKEQFQALLRKLSHYENLSPKQHFTHHRFGMLDRDKSLMFMEIHTEHHLKIIQDILR